VYYATPDLLCRLRDQSLGCQRSMLPDTLNAGSGASSLTSVNNTS
jgi:hypothetical protein